MKFKLIPLVFLCCSLLSSCSLLSDQKPEADVTVSCIVTDKFSTLENTRHYNAAAKKNYPMAVAHYYVQVTCPDIYENEDIVFEVHDTEYFNVAIGQPLSASFRQDENGYWFTMAGRSVIKASEAANLKGAICVN